ncbi:MAG: type II toxin-antitoxin system VapC family toxin [Thermodesulfobacteriota bacterium]
MITAVDTNIILDVLIPGDPFSRSSKEFLEKQFSKGKLIICEVVFAELAAHFPSEPELKTFLAETGIRLEYSSPKSLYIAGTRWGKYSGKIKKDGVSCPQCGQRFPVACPQCHKTLTRRLHVLADFLIGAHALDIADCLLTRDLGIYKTYFKDLKIVP